MWQCIREGRYNSTGAAYGVNFNAEDIKETEFKWLNIEGRNTLQTAVGLSDAREAIQKLDFVTDLAYTFDTSAAYADIVLPCATEWERVGGFAGHQRSRETVVVYSRVTEPLWEAKTEFEIGAGSPRVWAWTPTSCGPSPRSRRSSTRSSGAPMWMPPARRSPW